MGACINGCFDCNTMPSSALGDLSTPLGRSATALRARVHDLPPKAVAALMQRAAQGEAFETDGTDVGRLATHLQYRAQYQSPPCRQP